MTIERFGNLTDKELMATTGAVLKGLPGNKAFTNPPPQLGQLQTAADEMTAAMAAQAHGGRAATAEKTKKRAALIEILTTLARYVEANCGNDVRTLLSSGFPVAPAGPGPWSMPTLTTTQNPRLPVPLPPLVSSTRDGKPYKRPAHIREEIGRIFPLPRSRWAAEAENLQNETLVFLIRRTHRVNDEVCGGLLVELCRRINERTRRFARDLDNVDEEELLSNVEIRMLELVLTEERSRKQDILEVAFAQAVDRLAQDLLKKQRNSPMFNPAEIAADCSDEDGDQIERPIESVADFRPGPEDVLLNLDHRIHRHRLLRKALKAVTDPRHREAAILHYAYGVPITSTQRGTKNLKRHFRKDPRQIRYWIATAMKQMREALGIETAN